MKTLLSLAPIAFKGTDSSLIQSNRQQQQESLPRLFLLEMSDRAEPPLPPTL